MASDILHLKPQPPRLTRNEIALDRLERHSRFVTERRRRGIEQATDEAERERLAERLLDYDELIAAEFDFIEIRSASRANHPRHQEERQRPRPRKRSQPNFPMR